MATRTRSMTAWLSRLGQARRQHTAAAPAESEYPFAVPGTVKVSPSSSAVMSTPPPWSKKRPSVVSFKAFPPDHPNAHLLPFFSRRSKDRIPPMSIISVRSSDPSIDPAKPSASSVFTGVLTSTRHKGAATSFLVRSIVDDTGVEVRYNLASPLLKDVRILKKAGQADAAGNVQIKKVKMARVNFLERQPQRMPNVKGAVREQQRLREQERRRAPRR